MFHTTCGMNQAKRGITATIKHSHPLWVRFTAPRYRTVRHRPWWPPSRLLSCRVIPTDRSQYCVRMPESPAIQVSGYVTLLWKLQVLTAFRRENASESPFFAKDKSFPEKIRFSFGNYLNYYLQRLSFDVPAVIFTCQFLRRNLRRGKSFITPINTGSCLDMCSDRWVQPLFLEGCEGDRTGAIFICKTQEMSSWLQ